MATQMRYALVIWSVLAMSATARAEEEPRCEAAGRLEVGSHVLVRKTTGATLIGTVAALDGDQLSLDVGGRTVSIDCASIETVDAFTAPERAAVISTSEAATERIPARRPARPVGPARLGGDVVLIGGAKAVTEKEDIPAGVHTELGLLATIGSERRVLKGTMSLLRSSGEQDYVDGEEREIAIGLRFARPHGTVRPFGEFGLVSGSAHWRIPGYASASANGAGLWGGGGVSFHPGGPAVFGVLARNSVILGRERGGEETFLLGGIHVLLTAGIHFPLR